MAAHSLSRSAFISAAVGTAICISSSLAFAASDAEEVEQLIKDAVELRKEGRDERALLLFQKAFSIARTPRTTAQLGLCEMAVGYWTDADHHLTEGLSSPEHPWISKNRADLESALAAARKNIGELVVEGSPTGANVFLNGKQIGQLPLPAAIRLNKGPIEVELRSPGYESASKSTAIRGGDKERVQIALNRSTVAANEPSVSPLIAPPQESTQRSTSRPVAWALGGVAAAALIFGVVETFTWTKKQDEFDNHLGPLPSDPAAVGHNCGTDEPAHGGAGCQGIHDDLSRARLLAIVGYGVGAAAAATSIVLFATSASDSPRRDTAFSCAPLLPTGGLTCGAITRW